MYKRYERYKDSGIEWIGEIPEHWEELRLKYMAYVKSSNVDKKIEEGEQEVLLCNYTDVYYNDVIDANIEFMKATAKSEEIDKFELQDGDVIITKDSETWDDIAVPAYVPNKLDKVLCGYHLALIRSVNSKSLGRYIFRAFTSNGIRDQFMVSANGITRFGLSVSSIKSAVFPYPPLYEQETIANYLDKKTSEIDSLIADKEELIKKLEEYKQSIITEAVTKGLNPDVKMKDSGIEWIEEIPEHWEVSKFKRHIYIQEGPGILAQDFREFGIPLIRISGVKTSYVSLDGCNYLEQEMVEKRWKHFKLEIGDLLISCSASVDMISEVDEEAHGCIPYTGLIRMKPKDDNLIKQYLSYYIRSKAYMIQVDQLKAGSTIQHYGPTHIKEFHLLIPSYPEQKLVAEYLDQKTTEINEAVEETEKQIKSLKQYRQSLIYEAVTGKIDVREYEPERSEQLA